MTDNSIPPAVFYIIFFILYFPVAPESNFGHTISSGSVINLLLLLCCCPHGTYACHSASPYVFRNEVWSHQKSSVYILIPLNSGENSHQCCIYGSVSYLLLICFLHKTSSFGRQNQLLIACSLWAGLSTQLTKHFKTPEIT